MPNKEYIFHELCVTPNKHITSKTKGLHRQNCPINDLPVSLLNFIFTALSLFVENYSKCDQEQTRTKMQQCII